jgi:hypothetical protein
MFQVDPWEKAAECARAIQISMDPHRNAVLINLQQMWVGLGNQRDFLSQEELAREVEKIDRLQFKFGGADSVQINSSVSSIKTSKVQVSAQKKWQA